MFTCGFLEEGEKRSNRIVSLSLDLGKNTSPKAYFINEVLGPTLPKERKNLLQVGEE